MKRIDNRIELKSDGCQRRTGHQAWQLLGLVVLFVWLLSAVPAAATIYTSDHFDNQPDWNGCTDPPKPWSSYGWNSGYCNKVQIDDAWADAHGGGKSVKISWSQAMQELGMMTWSAEGKNEVWIGYWWKHNKGWNWGSEVQHKWFYGPETNGGDRMMIKFENRHNAFWQGKVQMSNNVAFNTDDDQWHSVIIYLKHSTNGGKDGAIRLWWDGVETTWSMLGSYTSNTALNFGSGNTWTSFMNFGYQSRPNWGAGNISYFDDIVVASTKQDVESFLGQSTPSEEPLPANSAPLSKAGSDQQVVDSDGNGSEQVTIDGSASTDSDGSIAAYSWKEGSTLLSTKALATPILTVGTHTLTLTVTDNEGLQASDTVTVTVQALQPEPEPEPQPEPGEEEETVVEGGALLLSETFADSNLAGRNWYDAGSSQAVIVTDNERGKVLEYAYASGASTPATAAIRHLFDETDEVTVTYNVKYQKDWIWTDGDSGPHEMYLMTNLDHAWKGPAQSHGTTYIEMHNGIQRLGFQDALNIDQTQIGNDLFGVTEKRGVFGCNGSSDGYFDGICWGDSGAKINGKLWDVSMAPIQNDRWYQLKIHLKMNSIVNGIGMADGVMEYWLDGVKMMSLRDVVIRTGANPDLKWNQVMLAPYFHNGTPKAQKFWIDDLTITSTPVILPSAPTGLTIK